MFWSRGILVLAKGIGGGSRIRTVRAAVVKKDVCVCVGLVPVLRVGFRDCDFVLVALAGAGAVEAVEGRLGGHGLAALEES